MKKIRIINNDIMRILYSKIDIIKNLIGGGKIMHDYMPVLCLVYTFTLGAFILKQK